MGKKTDKFMADIKLELDAWRAAKLRLVELGKLIKQATNSRDSAQKAMDAYYKKKGWQSQKAGREEAMDADATYTKLTKAFHVEYHKLEKLEKEVEQKMIEARTRKLAAAKLIKEFQTFLQNKIKTKKLPWQKSSVGAAGKFLIEAFKAFD